MSKKSEELAKYIEILDAKKARLKARQKEILRKEKAKERAEKKKTETRKKILIGDAVLALQETGEFSYDMLIEYIKNTLHEKDRHLFPNLFKDQPIILRVQILTKPQML